MKLYLIRHSLTPANEGRLYCGRTDLSLSPAGTALAREKAALGGYPPPEGLALYTSGLARAEETFALLYGPRPHGVLPAFREMDFGAFEMKSYQELKDRPDYQAWLTGDNEANPCPGGESGRDMACRALNGAEALLDGGRDALVLCHGGPIAALMEAWFPQEGRNRYQWQPTHCAGWAVEFRGRTPLSFAPVPAPFSV